MEVDSCHNCSAKISTDLPRSVADVSDQTIPAQLDEQEVLPRDVKSVSRPQSKSPSTRTLDPEDHDSICSDRCKLNTDSSSLLANHDSLLFSYVKVLQPRAVESMTLQSSESGESSSNLTRLSADVQSLLDERRLTFRNPVPNFDSKDAHHLVRASTAFVHHMYGQPRTLEERIVDDPNATRVGRFDEETCRQQKAQPRPSNGLTPENSDDEALLEDLIEFAEYDTSSPYDSDNPHCFSPFPAFSSLRTNSEDHHRGEYGIDSDFSDDDSALSICSEDAVFNTAAELALDLSKQHGPVSDDEKICCQKCSHLYHPLEIRCSVCLERRPPQFAPAAQPLPAVLPDSQDSGCCTVEPITSVQDDSCLHNALMDNVSCAMEASPSASNFCLMCTSAPRSGCMIHNGSAHNVTCFGCAKDLWRRRKPCPICRRDIDCVVELFND